MSDYIPHPEMNGQPEFDFAGLQPETVSAAEAPPSFEAPRKPTIWERMTKTDKREKKAPRERKPVPMPRGGLRKPLEDLYTSLGMMVMPFDAQCGKVIIEAAPRCAESLDDLAKANPAVRRLLISLVTTSALGAVIMAHAPIVMAVAMHHVPALRKSQEKMVADMAEVFANMPKQEDTE